MNTDIRHDCSTKVPVSLTVDRSTCSSYHSLFFYHCPFFSLSRFLFSFPFFFLTQIRFHTLSAVTEIYTFFLSLVFFFLSFFLLLYTVQSNTIQLQQVYTLSSSLWLSSFFLSFFLSSLHNSACNRDIYFLPLWFSLFFKRSLYSQRTNSFASSVINNAGYRLQFGVIELKYMFLYFLSGVAWDESDKFHHYQMSLIFPFISYQRFDFESCSFKDKTATDSNFLTLTCPAFWREFQLTPVLCLASV
ncbi:unnamed protein product [Acanthosepion pharaonis]|uniref:Uncharacterized protein n=1 Tax=Acanthosepion pharaonis TaxID=158019 RepID=A0A812C6P9_ACAPH|nr:unnamed protein product [Sepia pharaonis]